MLWSLIVTAFLHPNCSRLNDLPRPKRWAVTLSLAVAVLLFRLIHRRCPLAPPGPPPRGRINRQGTRRGGIPLLAIAVRRLYHEPTNQGGYSLLVLLFLAP